ncbi:MAG: hypothetical protein UZ14_CFX002000039 [Chloroflexi bacterium OLB14]|nr:MAG: hypothetical protein UZ14_CFX002000039 [Chloroflexi bacterium OLB14]
MKSEENLLNSFPKQMKEFIESKRKWIAEKEKAPEIPPNKRIFCNSCNRKTNHICKHNSRRYFLYSVRSQDRNPYSVNFDTWGYLLWECAGCETFCIEHYGIDETLYHPETTFELLEELGSQEKFDEFLPNPNIYSEFFPKRTEDGIVFKRYVQLPASLSNIYYEIVKAFNNEIPMLCAIGIRALIEGICFEHEIHGRNLEKKIEGLESILPKNIVTNLHNLRFMGNEAAHELNTSSQEELKLAIGICEDLLNYLYELDYKTNALNNLRKKQVPTQNNIDLDFIHDIKIWHGG